jgi:hypothetical protein
MKKLIASIFLSIIAYSGFSQKIMGENGKLLTTHNLSVDSPLVKINDSTIGANIPVLWKQGTNQIYKDSTQVVIYNDTAGTNANGSPALTLADTTHATSSKANFTPALSLTGTYWTGSASAPYEWRIFGTPLQLKFGGFANGALQSYPLILTPSTGTLTYNNATGPTLTATSSANLTNVTLSGVLTQTSPMFGGYTSYAWWSLSPTYTIQGGQTTSGTYRGIYFNPTINSKINARIVGFENTYGENMFNSGGLDRSGFGVTDSVNKSALVEMRSTTMGALIPRMTKAQRNAIISSLKGTISGGSGYFNAYRNNISLTGGSGTGATADLLISGGAVSSVWIREIGAGYVVGDVLSATVPGGGSGFTFTITEANPPAPGLQVMVTGETGGEYLSWYNSVTATWEKATSTPD